MNSVIIIGGGASGLMAAITAAENPNNHVTLLERQARPGRKLLATGNGRCNLTNTGAGIEDYHGGSPDFAKEVLNRFTPSDTLSFFRNLGLLTVEQYGGRVYPLSDSANSVLDVLRFAISSAGVSLLCPCTAKEIRSLSSGFSVITDTDTLYADSVIVACGGMAGGKVGGVRDGYELLKALGHPCTKLYPALVPIYTDTDYPRSLKGVRADASVKLFSGRSLFASSAGEVQFTERGVSGPAIFDVSRAAAVSGGTLELDFFRNFSAEDIFRLLRNRVSSLPELDCGSVFTGLLHNRLSIVLVKACSLKPSSLLSELSPADIKRLSEAAKHFRLEVRGTAGFDAAQVTAGGIDTASFRSDTLESRLVPGLFACGEVLDVDGNCGGYNLQWAWASGRTAGRLGK